ncbi:MAG: FAD-dependent oxidoreductase, partial [Acidimicrobiia bacterium]|nr:FAD-dependent oxidoreductase [Acidimicrobiia bacterium]
MEHLDVEVLIVGAGPVGLTAALLLQRLGCSVAIVERR